MPWPVLAYMGPAAYATDVPPCSPWLMRKRVMIEEKDVVREKVERRKLCLSESCLMSRSI